MLGKKFFTVLYAAVSLAATALQVRHNMESACHRVDTSSSSTRGML